jgi:endosialidase-like protein
VKSPTGSSLYFFATMALMAIISAVTVCAQNQQPINKSQHPTTTSSATSPSSQVGDKGAAPNTLILPILGKGTVNFIPLWTGNYTIGNSLLSQTGNGLNVAGAVTAVSFVGNGATLTNVNAATLGGQSSNNFAQLGIPNTFSADQTINGNLNVTGFLNRSLSLQGGLSDSLGEEGVNMIGGFQGDAAFPGNSVAAGVIGATIAGGGGAVSTSSLPAKVSRKRNARLHPAGFNVVQGNNVVTANWGTIGGGVLNCVNGLYATVAGGVENCAMTYGSVVGGGTSNVDLGSTQFEVDYSTIAGGLQNTASATFASIGGGQENLNQGYSATIAGGEGNLASNEGSTVGGGSSNSSTGWMSTIPGGQGNTAEGQYSFAAGYYAGAYFDGSFVWSDYSGGTGTAVNDTAPNQFIVRSSGGVTFYTASDLSAGVTAPSGSGSWSSLSDRNAKANFSSVDNSSLLEKLAAMPVSTWNYKAQADSIRHLGPTAQDFHEAFGLGEDDKHISTVDAEGVALAAVQALYKLTQAKDQQIAELQQALDEVKAELRKLTDVAAGNR